MAKQKLTKQQKIGITAGTLIILFGVCMLLYPTFANIYNQSHATKAIAAYNDTVTSLTTENYDQIWADAKAYNASLINNETRFLPNEKEHLLYMNLLDITGTGIMGYIEIPNIKVMLPIYHTTEDTVLQIAAGHLEGTSLPIGGPGTHAGISGHSGMTSAKLFTNLEKLDIDDSFFIHVLDTTLKYEIDQIDVVLPEETEVLQIDPEQDYCTLITCTPYGVNSHRLLIRGKRIPYEIPQETEIDTQPETQQTAKRPLYESMTIAAMFTIAITTIIILTVLIIRTYTKKRKN